MKPMPIDFYNLTLNRGGDNDPVREKRRSQEALVRVAYGMSFDAQYGFPCIRECAHTLKIGSCPQWKINGKTRRLELCKPVVRLDEDGKVIARYDSAFAAETATGGTKDHIARMCRGERNGRPGFRW